MRSPTEKQLARLAILSRVGTGVVAPTRKEWRPLLQRGLVTPTRPWVNSQSLRQGERFLPPLEITPDGLEALAAFHREHGRWPGQP